MQLTNKEPSKIQVKSQPHDVFSETFTPEVLPRNSSSSLSSLYSSPEFNLSWDNDVKHHISQYLLHLRQYRRESQADVAKKIGTSQSAIAQVETGESNFTANTIERMLGALRGRFLVCILPEEFPYSRPTPWWESHHTSTTNWTVQFVMHTRVGTVDRALIGIERSSGDQLMLTTQGT
jgi:transcriptional regulator with XRE-family HTH domain